MDLGINFRENLFSWQFSFLRIYQKVFFVGIYFRGKYFFRMDLSVRKGVKVFFVELILTNFVSDLQKHPILKVASIKVNGGVKR